MKEGSAISVRQLMSELEKSGIRLWEEAGQLRFRAPKGVMTEERITALRAEKESILAVLRANEPTVTPDPANRYEPFPLTDVQAAYLLGRHDSFGYGCVSCHIYLELEYPALDPARLEDAWNRLIAHHEMLRAVVHSDGYQRVLPEVPRYRIPVAELRAASPEEVEARLVDVRDELGHQVHTTDEWPLFELRITQTPNRAILHVSLDFMIADWGSIQQLLTQLEHVRTDPEHELPTAEIGFRDYVLAERGLRDSVRYQRDRDYWRARIDELPAAPELPVLDSGTGTPRFHRHTLTLNSARWAELKRRASSVAGVTPSGAVMTAYADVIGRWSRRPAFTLNLTLLNRLPLHPQVDALIGDFTSVTLLAVRPGDTSTFADRATRLGQQLFDDMDHRLFSGIEVMRELARRRSRDEAMMPVVFTSAIGLGVNQADGPVDAGEFGFGITQTPQVWIDCQALDRHDELIVNWDVRDGVFPDGLVTDMFDAFGNLLIGLGTSEATWRRAAPVPLPPAQRARRSEVNNTSGPLPPALLHEEVFAQARRHPGRRAVIDRGGKHSYAEVCGRAAAVAAALDAAAIVPGELVAVVMDKGMEQVSAVLGTLLAGGAYLPIDTNQPAARRDRILADAAVRLVLADGGQPFFPDGVRHIAMDTLPAAEAPTEPVPRRVGPDDLAYVIYTSGSTGNPKGVMISHRAAANTVADINERFAVDAEDRVLGLANLGFDLSVYDIFGPLSVGGGLVLPDPDRRADPSHWAEVITKHDVTRWNSVPAQLQMLGQYLDTEPELTLPSLSTAMLSGDWIPVTLPDEIRNRVPGLQLISLGGATEASIWSIYYPIEQVDPSWRSIPYGYPLRNQTFHVLDHRLHDCLEWTAGELYIGGVGVAMGYLHDDARTAERFVRHPETGERLYRTGDYGRYLPSGVIEFLGREDHQVKIRGHRIELAEVEAAVQSHPAVRATAVVVEGTDPLRRRLVAFVEPDATAGFTPERLEHYLAELLPEYMRPAVIHPLGAMPVTDNGKLDRRALIAELSRIGTATSTPEKDRSAGDLEARLAALWAEVLEVPWVGRNDDFFALGGNSLLATQLVGKLRERVPEAAGMFFDSLVRKLLPEPSVAALARHLTAQAPMPITGSRHRIVSPLIRLGKGDAEPVVVLVHDGTGELDCYQPLTEQLDPGRAVFGFTTGQPDAYLRVTSAALVPRRANGYARLVRAQRPRRTYIVGRGGAAVLALEVARGLMENGVEVAGVTLVDGYRMPELHPDDLLLEYLFAVELGADPVAAGYPVNPVGLASDGDTPELRAGKQAKRLAAIGAAAGVMSGTGVATRYEVFRHTLLALADYRVEPYLGPVTVLGGPRADSMQPLASELEAAGVIGLELVEHPPGQPLAGLALRLNGGPP